MTDMNNEPTRPTDEAESLDEANQGENETETVAAVAETQPEPETESDAEAGVDPTADEISRAQAHALALRTLEAVLFAAPEPLDAKALAKRLPKGADVDALVDELEAHYANRGINLARVAGKFAFRTASDLASALQIETVVPRKLSRAAIETMSIIAYHQPVTRAEIEEIRGVALSRGTLDTLMEAGWIQPKGHRETPGHPATWVTTDAFLSHFGLNSTKDLPGIEELKAAGLLDARATVSAYSEEGQLGDAQAAEGEGEEEESLRAELEPEAEGEPSDAKPSHAGSE